MLDIDVKIGFSNFLLLIHGISFAIAVFIWTFKKVKENWMSIFLDILGVVSIPIALIVLSIISDDRSRGAKVGDPVSWFVLLSELSAGLLPLFTLSVYFISGRFIGRIIHGFRSGK